jgi:Zn-dependent protease
MDLTSGSFRLFRAAGISVYLHWSWLLWAWVVITLYPERYQAPAWKVVEYVSLFAIVLLHEFGHAFACRSVGGRADRIVLWPLGGVAYVAPPPRPGAFLWSIAAGPLVNLLLFAASILLWIAVPDCISWDHGWSQRWPEDVADPNRFLSTMAVLNAFMLLFNLLPIFPLDGGQILQGLLWFGVGRLRSLQLASLTGIVLGGLGFLCSLVLPFGLPGILLAFLAAFIAFHSYTVFQHAGNALYLLELPRHDECACRFCGIAPPRGPFWVCDHCRTRFDLFDTRGKCPACGAWYLEPDCPHCRHTNHIDRWFSSPEENGEAPGDSLPAPPATSAPSSEGKR